MLVSHCSFARRAALKFYSYQKSRRPAVADVEMT
jgi:hypothetical protein